MRAGVAVAADDQATGKAEAKLGSDDMDNALPASSISNISMPAADVSVLRPASSSCPVFARAGPTRAVEMAWSGVAKVSSGLWTARLRLLRSRRRANRRDRAANDDRHGGDRYHH